MTGNVALDVVIGLAFVVLADENDSQWLQRWIDGTNARALSSLPNNVIVLDKVDIVRK